MKLIAAFFTVTYITPTHDGINTFPNFKHSFCPSNIVTDLVFIHELPHVERTMFPNICVPFKSEKLQYLNFRITYSRFLFQTY